MSSSESASIKLGKHVVLYDIVLLNYCVVIILYDKCKIITIKLYRCSFRVLMKSASTVVN